MDWLYGGLDQYNQKHKTEVSLLILKFVGYTYYDKAILYKKQVVIS